MSVIFAGGELSSFAKFNANETTLANSFREPARCGIHVGKLGWVKTDTIGDRSEIWIHCDMSVKLVDAALVPINVTNAAGVSLFSVTSAGKVYAGTAPIGTAAIFTQGFFTLDIHLRGGASGLIEIYADSQIMFSATGNFTLTGMRSLTLSPTGTSSTDGDTNTVWSQIIIADETTIDYKLATLVLDPVGSQLQWIGGASDVNELVLDTSTYISAATVGLYETWNASDLDSRYTNIRAVVISALGKFSTTGPKNLDAIVRIGTGNYPIAMPPLGTGLTPSSVVFHTDPTTSGSWTRDVVNASEFGIRSRS